MEVYYYWGSQIIMWILFVMYLINIFRLRSMRKTLLTSLTDVKTVIDEFVDGQKGKQKDLKDFLFEKLDDLQGYIKVVETLTVGKVALVESSLAKYKRFVEEHHAVGVDVSPTGHDPTYAIIVGKYRNHDFVHCYRMHHDNLKDLVPHLRELDKRFGNLRIDAPPSIRGFFEHELEG